MHMLGLGDQNNFLIYRPDMSRFWVILVLISSYRALADKGAIAAAPVWRSPEITYITERGARHSYHFIRGCGGGARRPPGFGRFFDA